MKSIVFRLLTSCVAIFAITVFAGFAIGQNPLPFNYQVKYSLVINGLSIEDVVRINDGINDGLYVVGSYSYVGGDKRGFIYRYVNPENKQFIDMPTLVGLADSDFIRCVCFSMNESGRVVAAVRDSDNRVHAVYFDLFDSAPVLHSLNDKFAEIPPPTENGSYPNRINSVGDMLMFRGGIVVNPRLNQAYLIPGANEIDNGLDINDSGTVLMGTSTSGPLRSNILEADSAEFFPEFKIGGNAAINNDDQFCARQDIPAKRNQVKVYALRYSGQVDWYSDPFEVLSTDSINDSGDICGEVAGFGNPDGYLHYSIGTVSETGPTVGLQSLITDEYFASGDLWRLRLTNRIELSPTLSAPIVCGAISHDTERRIFFLFPELPDSNGTEPYSSDDTPLEIPDNNLAGVSSKIVVLDEDDFLIAGLTVTLDISHSRPSDLVVELYGPNNALPVKLSTFSGDNIVSDFNNTRTPGTWTLKVVDTTRRRTGTLNSWSITVDKFLE